MRVIRANVFRRNLMDVSSV